LTTKVKTYILVYSLIFMYYGRFKIQHIGILFAMQKM